MRNLLCFVMVATFLGCAEAPSGPKNDPPIKKVASKVQATEQRLSIDIFDKQGIRGRATTVFYLIADDGSTAEVDMKTWAKTKEGEEFQSWKWK